MSKRLNATLAVGTRGNYANIYLADDGTYEVEYMVLMSDKRTHRRVANLTRIGSVRVLDRRIKALRDGR